MAMNWSWFHAHYNLGIRGGFTKHFSSDWSVEESFGSLRPGYVKTWDGQDLELTKNINGDMILSCTQRGH